MCNLYSSFTTQETMRRVFEVGRDSAGNVPPLPAIFPDQMAPVPGQLLSADLSISRGALHSVIL
jgi:hypothetical protein